MQKGNWHFPLSGPFISILFGASLLNIFSILTIQWVLAFYFGFGYERPTERASHYLELKL